MTMANSLISDLVVANRILFSEGVLDGFGHVSVRDARNADRFWLARSMAAGLVEARDIMAFDLDGAPIDARGRAVFLERFIHSEIYRARPDVQSVVHSHSPNLVPFGVTPVKLKPLYHMTGFLGDGVPVFEIRKVAGAEHQSPHHRRPARQGAGQDACRQARGADARPRLGRGRRVAAAVGLSRRLHGAERAAPGRGDAAWAA